MTETMERYLIEHCAPTLASVKAASLFNACCEEGEDIERQVAVWNGLMNPKGVTLTILKKRGNRALIYVYREHQLQRNLVKSGVPRFLKSCGYDSTDVTECLEKLKQRFAAGEEFPHEIGVFLDYPLGDVIGFIQNGGQNYKCSGCWKVYCNECETMKQFEKYRKCRNIYRSKWEGGRSILQLTVAA